MRVLSPSWCLILGLGCACGDPGGGADGVSADLASVDLSPAASDGSACDGPGQSMGDGSCVVDCRRSGSTPCGAALRCDALSGQCLPATAPCLVPLAYDACPGAAAQRCGPGSVCQPDGRCALDGTCGGSLQCDASGACQASGCTCQRPAAACTPAALERLNQAPFNTSAWDLKFDGLCTAYTVTVQSGTDYLRQLQPDGVLVNFTGQASVDMVEVAPGPLPGDGKLGTIALSYYSGGPGLTRLDRRAAQADLTRLISATASGGAGPIDRAHDGGLLGLTYGMDGSLYVGNVNFPGEICRVNLEAQQVTSLFVADQRVYAATAYDSRHLLVGLSDQSLILFDVTTREAAPFASLDGAIASVQRDRFTGVVYVAVSGPPRILALSGDGQRMTQFQSVPRPGRLAIAPDGFLYHVASTADGSALISRWPLPAER